MTAAVLVATLLFLLLAGLWIMVPAMYGLPTVPARRDRVRAALRLANVRPGERLYDLGAGDGRVLVIARREFGARAVGIEVGPIQCVLLWLTMQWNSMGEEVEIRWGDFFHADIHDADVVYAYVTRTQLQRLEALAASQLRPGARLVMMTNELPGWKAAAVDREALVFLYVMPAR